MVKSVAFQAAKLFNLQEAPVADEFSLITMTSQVSDILYKAGYVESPITKPCEALYKPVGEKFFRFREGQREKGRSYARILELKLISFRNKVPRGHDIRYLSLTSSESFMLEAIKFAEDELLKEFYLWVFGKECFEIEKDE